MSGVPASRHVALWHVWTVSERRLRGRNRTRRRHESDGAQSDEPDRVDLRATRLRKHTKGPRTQAAPRYKSVAVVSPAVVPVMA